jgi:type IV pilus assembly protein PilM
MGFSIFQGGGPPIAIDFGSASAKILQARMDDRPVLQAAAELPIPDSIRGDHAREVEYLHEFMPSLMSRARFKGRRAIISVPGSKTLVQHMNLPKVEGTNDLDLINGQLSAQFGCPADAIVTRHVEVCDVHRGGAAQREVLVFAIPRETIMRYVQLLRKMKLEVVGVHSAPHALVHSFAHLNRRTDDREVVNCYINIGWSNTLVAIAHGPNLVFARQVEVGGRHFDEQIAQTLRCDIAAARAHRLSMGDMAERTAVKAPAATAMMGVASAAADGDTLTAEDRRDPERTPSLGATVESEHSIEQLRELNLLEMLDVISDELSMSIRYHKGLFRDREIDRVIFLGGESRQLWLCRHLTRQLGAPAQLGDPLTRFQAGKGVETPGLDLGEPQPGWAVACGLSQAPTDL